MLAAVSNVFTEPLHPGAFIVAERDGYYSRDVGVIPQSQSFMAGTVLGRTVNLALVTIAVTQASGNVGDGVVTMDPTTPVRGDAMDGPYQVEFITAGATAEFNVLDPAGALIGTGAVGGGFAGQIKFTIADDAAHHYAVGDRVLITVAIPVSALQYEALNLAATDGSQTAYAVAVYPAATGAGQTTQIAVLVRDASVRGSDLTWPAGATSAQIAEGINQLRKRYIIVR